MPYFCKVCAEDALEITLIQDAPGTLKCPKCKRTVDKPHSLLDKPAAKPRQEDAFQPAPYEPGVDP